MTIDPKSFIKRAQGIHETLAKCHPSLARGMVWCRKCGRSQKVDTARCFAHGWPECCGETMTIDSPEERAMSRKLAEEMG
ncbi:MAG: hypothetical protein KIT32_12200 [Rhodocyclaceae bacterium]|nr:hypothetical protein [Rhodocyclaceae bacterium]